MAHMTDQQIALLQGQNFGVVGTVGANGRPQTSVVWVDWDGENVVFNTTNKRAKGRNLRENPRVSISVWDSSDPYHYFEVEGPAELDETGAAEHINELSRRYAGKDFHTPVDRVIVRIKPERVLDHLDYSS
ncbi:MAG TPA: PPOX class F420-dependent oxidoreductase [Gaiellaceae bacterium]|nr:PPOX class F420-dependent oxidoreductase [Gaiellaceae bacterium]